MTFTEFPECERKREDKIITLKDRNGGNSKYIGNNPRQKQISEIEVDGCVIKDPNKRKCDYLILDFEDKLSYFIELKGSNLNDAYQQITDTIQEFKRMQSFKSNVFDRRFKVFARVVLATGNVPRIIPSSYQKLVKLLQEINCEKIKDGIHIKRIKSGQVEIL